MMNTRLEPTGPKPAKRATGYVVAPDASEKQGLSPAPPADHSANDTAEPVVGGLIFEMANVLYDATLWWRWFAQLLHRLHPHLDCAQLDLVWTSEYLRAVRCGRREFSEALEAFLLRIELPQNEIDEVLAAGLCRRRDLEFQVLPFPGVKITLHRLHSMGLPLAIVSDSANTSDELVERLARLGLGTFFQFVISSVELEQTKPDPLCYLTAIQRLGVPAEQLWFVGQTADDLFGAQRVGLRTIAYGADETIASCRSISRFDALVELLPNKRSVTHR